jgi:predicted glycogen debranching enzyme
VRHELATNAYPGTLQPQGYRAARSFALDPLPTLVWELPDARLTRIVARLQNEPATVIVYHYEGGASVVLELRPMAAFRDAAALQHERVSPEVTWHGGDLVLKPGGACPALVLRVAEAAWNGDGYWYHSFEYERDRELGRDYSEDLYSPGVFSVRLEPGRGAAVLAWADEIPPVVDAAALVVAERKRLREIAGGADGLLGELRRSASVFLVRNPETGRRVLPGFPAAAEAPGETLLCLPGLCLAQQRYDDAS